MENTDDIEQMQDLEKIAANARIYEELLIKLCLAGSNDDVSLERYLNHVIFNVASNLIDAPEDPIHIQYTSTLNAIRLVSEIIIRKCSTDTSIKLFGEFISQIIAANFKKELSEYPVVYNVEVLVKHSKQDIAGSMLLRAFSKKIGNMNSIHDNTGRNLLRIFLDTFGLKNYIENITQYDKNLVNAEFAGDLISLDNINALSLFNNIKHMVYVLMKHCNVDPSEKANDGKSYNDLIQRDVLEDAFKMKSSKIAKFLDDCDFSYKTYNDSFDFEKIV